MPILLPGNDFWNSLNKNSSLFPLVLVDGESCLYFLVRDIHKDLDEFISTGRAETTEFKALDGEQEQEIIGRCAQLGLTVTYRSQQVEYMYRRVTVAYIHVSDTNTGISISLIPWFMLPGRPYPVFVYIYSICHYQRSEKKSLSLSASAAGKVFGIGSLNKSTVSRNIKAMEAFVDIARIDDRPLAAGVREAATDGAGKSTDAGGSATVSGLISRIPEILKNCHNLESFKEEYGEKIKHLPEPLNRGEKACRALDGIPDKCFQVIKEGVPLEGKSRDNRKRPARPRHEGRGESPKRVQRAINFADSQAIEKTRKEFIEICLHIVLDAATTYHRFLI